MHPFKPNLKASDSLQTGFPIGNCQKPAIDLPRLDFGVGRTKRSVVPAPGRPAGTALRLVRPTDSTPIRCRDKATGRVLEARFKAAIPVAWTFMSEIFAKHRRIAEPMSSHNNPRSDSVSWPCDGHECPSYIRSFSPQNPQNQKI